MDIRERVFEFGERLTIGEYIDKLLEKCDLPKDEGLKNELVSIIKEYEEATDKKFERVKTIRGALYLLLKRKGLARDPCRMLMDSDKREKKNPKVFRAWKEVAREIDEPIVPFMVEDWFPRILNLVEKEVGEFSGKEKKEMKSLLDKLQDEFNLGTGIGRSPKVLASAIVFYCLKRNGKNISLREMSDYTQTSKYSVEKAYENIKSVLQNSSNN